MKMNKLIKAINKFIDKKIILPIAKLFNLVSTKFKGNSKNFEKLITKKSGMIVISLIIALGLFWLAVNKSDSLIEKSAEVLYNQPITATYNEEAYVVRGLPKTVDITLVGRKSDIYLAKQLPTNDITVDLTGLSPGVHKVNLKYKKALSSVEYKLDPSVATIVIYEKATEEKDVSYEIINNDKLDSKYMVDSVSLNKDKVYVKSDEATLKKVAYVKALIDLDKLTDDQRKNSGKVKIPVKLVAYDKNSNKVNVEIAPSSVTATLNITSPSKEVPIKLIPTGSVVFGKAISTLTSDKTNVTVYGKASKLEKISYIPVYVNVDGLKENKQYSLTIDKPKGVKSISDNSVNVSVTLGDEITKEFSDIYIESKNLPDGYTVQAVDANSTKVNVSVSGVASVVNNIDPTTIQAYVDLKKVTEGEVSVKVKVKGSDLRATYTSMTQKVTLRITKK